MEFNCKQIVSQTQTLLKLQQDVSFEDATAAQLHDCLGQVIMMNITERWSECKRNRGPQRHAYYFSAEYLIGRLVYSNLFNLGILEELKAAFAEKGVDLADLEEVEDAALGNGGLGRLAACFMDAAVTTGVPLTGYGLRYKFGLFKQSWDQYGDQKQSADDWSKYGDPWSYRRYKHTVKIDFPDHSILAVPYDVPVIGFKNNNIGTLRLWQCEAEEELDFDAFNAQEYERALAAKNKAEDITRVLYPNDSNREGKRLRIKQQYVLSSASVQDILRAFREYHGTDYNRLPEFVSIQLNDTHPAMSAAELVRLLMKEGYSFDTAFDISRRVFSYTNHTVMSEALEKWPLDLLASVVPEIVDIIWAIHHKLQSEHPQLYIIKDNTAHMANLSIYMGTSVNGVAQIHSELIKTDIFADWYAVYPERFKNVTNGITPRRWLGLCNSELTSMLEDYCGEGFLTNLDQLETLKTKIDKEMIDRFNGIKYEKKKQLCALIKEREGVELNPDFVFDIQVKRLHEYKRQLLNAFSVMDIYFDLKEGKLPNFNPTAFIFGAKAAPGYHRAKSIIRYINRIANLVNNDPEVNDKIKVVFVQNYNCSYAEYLIPAADISEQISPAGTEASGTGNMKFMLNGAVTLGTLDGANVEIVEKAGNENNYIFGATIEDIERIKNSYRSRDIYDNDYRIRRVVDTLVDGTVPTDDGMRELHTALIDGASYHKPDHYYLLLDYVSYLVTKKRAISDWSNRDDFARKCLMNIGSAGKFSSDRSITDYAKTIWYV